MAERRPVKDAIRARWVKECLRYDGTLSTTAPTLYMTLPGEQGLDIGAIEEAGLIRRTTGGAIVIEHALKVVAVEKSSQAVLALQRRFPGLRILTLDLLSLVRGELPYSWPDSEDEKAACRARVVNLDVNGSLAAKTDVGPTMFPLLAVVAKIAQMHSHVVPEWTLLLTLNADTPWASNVWDEIAAFIAENVRNVGAFRDDLTRIVGDQLIQALLDDKVSAVDISSEQETARAILMAFVPKKIAELVRTQGWELQVVHNSSYPGAVGSRGLITWTIRFRSTAEAITKPTATYQSSVATILSHAEFLGHDV